MPYTPEQEKEYQAWIAEMEEKYAGKGDSGLDMIDGNNEGELTIALGNIERVMKQGKTYGEAVQLYGIRGHPYFADFWPATELWGDAKWADEERKRMAKLKT